MIRQCAERQPESRARAGKRREGKRGVFVGESEGLFFGEEEAIGLFVVADVATCGLGRKPFADVAFVGTGFCGKLGRGQWLGGESFVEAEFFTDHDHAGMNGGPQIADKAAEK
jgi:hypothetical protein